MQNTTQFIGFKRSWLSPLSESEPPVSFQTVPKLDPVVNRNSISFSIMSYNILAQSLCNRRGTLSHCSKEECRWNFRRENLRREIAHHNMDIIGLQELDYYDTFWKQELEKMGYLTEFSPQFNAEKNNQPMPYGLLIGFKKDKFKLVRFEVIDYKKEIMNKELTLIEQYEVGMSGNIAMVAVLESVQDPHLELIVANTHLYWRPVSNLVRCRQIEVLLDRVKEIQLGMNSDKVNQTILLGDFNTSPNDPPYSLVTSRSGVSAEEDENAKLFWDRMNSESDTEMSKIYTLHVENEEFCKEKWSTLNSGLDFETFYAMQLHQRLVNAKQCVEKIISKHSKYQSLYAFYPKFCPPDLINISIHNRWNNGDLNMTTYTPNYQSTLDYIFLPTENSTCECLIEKLWYVPNHEEMISHVKRVSSKGEISESEEPLNTFLPNSVHSSDHLPIAATLQVAYFK